MSILLIIGIIGIVAISGCVQQANQVIPPQNLKEFEYPTLTCSVFKMDAAARGVPSGPILDAACEGICGKNNLTYTAYECRTDKLICKCKQ